MPSSSLWQGHKNKCIQGRYRMADPIMKAANLFLLIDGIAIAPDKRGCRVNVFLIYPHNVHCGYSLEAPFLGISNEYTIMFSWEK